MNLVKHDTVKSDIEPPLGKYIYGYVQDVTALYIYIVWSDNKYPTKYKLTEVDNIEKVI